MDDKVPVLPSSAVGPAPGGHANIPLHSCGLDNPRWHELWLAKSRDLPVKRALRRPNFGSKYLMERKLGQFLA